MRVGFELAIIISYPTSASGIIVLIKTPTKYREFSPNLFVITTDIFSLFLILSRRVQLLNDSVFNNIIYTEYRSYMIILVIVDTTAAPALYIVGQ